MTFACYNVGVEHTAEYKEALVAREQARKTAQRADPKAWRRLQEANRVYANARYAGAITEDHRRERREAAHAALHADPALHEAYLEATRVTNRLRYQLDPWYKKTDADRAESREKERTLRADPERLAALRARKAKYARERRKVDENFRVRDRLRARLRSVVRGEAGTSRADKYGIDWAAIVAHLGPCPGDPAGYHVDHIKPLASFDLSDPEQVRAAFAPENHQWLTVDANLAKSDKVE